MVESSRCVARLKNKTCHLSVSRLGFNEEKQRTWSETPWWSVNLKQFRNIVGSFVDNEHQLLPCLTPVKALWSQSMGVILCNCKGSICLNIWRHTLRLVKLRQRSAFEPTSIITPFIDLGIRSLIWRTCKHVDTYTIIVLIFVKTVDQSRAGSNRLCQVYRAHSNLLLGM